MRNSCTVSGAMIAPFEVHNRAITMTEKDEYSMLGPTTFIKSSLWA